VLNINASIGRPKCLEGDFGGKGGFGESESGSMLQDFRTEVVDVLKRAAESV